jgi:exopolysaccharide biosynthesis protein
MNAKNFKKTVAIIAILLGSTTVAFGLTQSEKGKLNFAGMCTGVADEGNKILLSDGKDSSFNSIKIAAAEDIQGLRSLPGATEAFDDFYQVAIEGMKDYEPDVKSVAVIQFLAE